MVYLAYSPGVLYVAWFYLTVSVVAVGLGDTGLAKQRSGILQLYAEWIALSCADVIVHSKSGLSSSAAMWADLPVESIRLLSRWLNDGTPLQTCETSSYAENFYEVACTV